MHERNATRIIAALVLVISMAACASSPPERPAARPATSIDKVYPAADFDQLWEITRTTLKADPRLFLDTIDKAGRFVAKEHSSGFIFFQERTVLDIKIKQLPDDKCSLTLKATAEKYDLGGLSRRAGWYPSDQINVELAEGVVKAIEARLAEGSQ